MVEKREEGGEPKQSKAKYVRRFGCRSALRRDSESLRTVIITHALVSLTKKSSNCDLHMMAVTPRC